MQKPPDMHGVTGKPGDAIPPKAQRERLRAAVRDYVRRMEPIPPLSGDELGQHCAKVMEQANAQGNYRNFIAVLLNNEVWRPAMASVPYDRRLLLLPKCLRDERACPAKADEFGLVCEGCGRCPIHDLKSKAEQLGYVVLVAEGIPVVMSLVESGRIEGIIGVSCLASLERVFPFIEMAAVPSLAIPLLHDGCANTAVDLDWVWDAIQLTGPGQSHRLDMDALRTQAELWFSPQALDDSLGPASTQTEQIARQWLARSGKRWRPFLAVLAYQALQQTRELSPGLRKLAVAVECFHKASLVHDDIEDQDALRYGQKTMHEEYGIPVALNVGDFLLGEGYRMIGECDAPAERKARMLMAAAIGHRNLCIGQGAELCWMRDPAPLTPEQVIEIFSKKTSPAFEVALKLGALYAGAEEGVWDVLHQYSRSLGIAYQIRDDLDDLLGEGDPSDAQAMRPSLMLALAHQFARGEAKELMENLWRRRVDIADVQKQLDELLADPQIRREAYRLMELHKQQAIRCLSALASANLKGMLRRVIGRIFHDMETKGWFRELATGHAPLGEGVDPLSGA